MDDFLYKPHSEHDTANPSVTTHINGEIQMRNMFFAGATLFLAACSASPTSSFAPESARRNEELCTKYAMAGNRTCQPPSDGTTLTATSTTSTGGGEELCTKYAMAGNRTCEPPATTAP